MAFTAGDHLGPYKILSQLGSGGMGEVFLANDTRLYRNVAIKVLPENRVTDPEWKRRFMHEARAASALSHPNIVTIFDIAAGSDSDYLVMEYVPGQSLDKVIPAGGIPVRQVVSFAQLIASALVAAHAAGIVHRDLKPANVMIADSGVIKVLDFGIAKFTRTSTALAAKDETETMLSMPVSSGSIVGTVNYMSPEQAQGKPLDARSDVFSFGAMLYEMLTGSRAFQGETVVDTLAAILRDDVGPIVSQGSPVPNRLEEIVRRCLKKQPDDRWQAMREVQEALAAITQEANTATIAAPQPATPTRRYAGFWIRGAARGVDLVILAVASSVLLRLLPFVPFGTGPTTLIVLGGLYEVYFVANRGATIGKMAFNLQIVRSTGMPPVTIRLALARYLAMGVSAVTAMMGFVIAGFDREKRALHDRICETRVIFR